MNSREKANFIAKSMISAIKGEMEKLRRREKKNIKELLAEKDPKKTLKFASKLTESGLDAIEAFEQENHIELEGKNFTQYFDSFTNIGEYIEIVTAINSYKNCPFPNTFLDKLGSLNEELINELSDYLEKIKADSEGGLGQEERAAIQISGIVGSRKFIDPLINILKGLTELANSDDYMALGSALSNIGYDSLQPLMDELNEMNPDSKCFRFTLLTIGRLASEQPSEEMYRFLKEKFRKSNLKLVEAGALALYGDGRAIPAIRGYVEKNIESLHPWEYNEYRDIIDRLGGDISDLDEYFDDFEDWEDIGDED